MKVELKPASVIKARLGVQNGGPVHAFFTNTCALHMDRYTPWKTGDLARTVVDGNTVNSTNVTVDTITYNVNYAKYVYYPYRQSIGRVINYTTETHRLAFGYWDKIMWEVEKDEVVKEVQDFIDRGGKQ